MLAITQQSLPGTQALITFKSGIPAMSPTEKNKQLLEKYSQVSMDLGQGVIKPLDPSLRGAGDISHVAAIVPANLAGLGAAGYGEHSENEHIELSSLPIQTVRAAIFIYRLTQ
jgi:glutamate carboxypeptidase